MEGAPIGESFRNIFKIEELRRRVFFTLGMLVVFRLGVHMLLPGVSPGAVAWLEAQSETLGGVMAYINAFSGGGFDNVAIFALGIMPYITASIILQLMTKVHPRLEEIVKEGPAGQRRIAVWTRWLTIPIALVQGIMGLNFLASAMPEGQPLFVSGGFLPYVSCLLALIAGSMFVMWLGEQISEHGLGNGASILIMVGIVGNIPSSYLQMFTMAQTSGGSILGIDDILIITTLYVGSIVGIVFVTQAQRRIPIQHAKHFRGRRMVVGSSRNYLPLKVNAAGVMPLIFASALLIIPQVLGQIPFFGWVPAVLSSGNFPFVVFYSGMIFFFSYFWTYLFFQPTEIAKNLKEYGSFVPGIRPGEQTAAYINQILAHITFFGAAFLAVVALFPQVVSAASGAQRFMITFLGGTGILIVVGVNLDVMQKIESHLLMHHYTGFTGSGRTRGRR